MKAEALRTVDRDVVAKRTTSLLEQSQDDLHRRTDRLFANLMVAQWLAGIGAALWISPLTWIGANSHTHLHVWVAVFLGGAITGFPVFLAWKHPGRTLTRHTIAIAQTLTSALWIHLTGGRIETHFHVFGSLAFLAFYRDWRVLLTATAVVAMDHCVRGLFWPQSVFGVLTASSWRWVEHAGWVVFEDIFLIIAIRQNTTDMFQVAAQRAGLEAVNADIERQVAERTAELTLANSGLQASERRFRSLSESAPIGIFLADTNGCAIYNNPHWLRLAGLTLEESLGEGWQRAVHVEDGAETIAEWKLATAERREFDREFRLRTPDNQVRVVHAHAVPIMSGSEITGFVGTASDITERKRAEIELAKAQKELLASTHQAGMAEVATAVLHNVGNVLNSANVSVDTAAKMVSGLKVASLGRIAALLREHAGNLPAFVAESRQGAQLPAFLGELADHFVAGQAAVLGEFESLRASIEHINQIVAMQQTYATAGGVTETLPLADVIGDALRMNSAAFERHGTHVECDLDATLPPVTIDRHKLLQILVNLLRNAKYACDDASHGDKRITVRAHSTDPGSVKIVVSDRGAGIPTENLPRIFEHGFTTRKDGHGFGLHSSALAAREMGGALRAHSDGPGCGATFTIEIPLSKTTK